MIIFDYLKLFKDKEKTTYATAQPQQRQLIISGQNTMPSPYIPDFIAWNSSCRLYHIPLLFSQQYPYYTLHYIKVANVILKIFS